MQISLRQRCRCCRVECQEVSVSSDPALPVRLKPSLAVLAAAPSVGLEMTIFGHARILACCARSVQIFETTRISQIPSWNRKIRVFGRCEKCFHVWRVCVTLDVQAKFFYRVEKCEKSSKMDQFSRFSRKISLYSTTDVWVELDLESRPPPIPKLGC